MIVVLFTSFCRFFRRGWITFDRSVNIKEICWDLNNIRVSEITQGQVPQFVLEKHIVSIQK